MIYSVYDWRSGKYNYYQDMRSDVISDAPPKASVRAKTPVGVAPDDIAVKLPRGVRKVGNGVDAKGQIAVSGFDVTDSTNKILIAAIAAVAIWAAMRR